MYFKFFVLYSTPKSIENVAVKMIKPILFLIAFSALPFISFAQNWIYGVSINPGYSQLIGSSSTGFNFGGINDLDFNYNFSGNVGLYLEKQSTQHTFFGAELLWVWIDGNATIGEQSLSDGLEYNLEYLGVAIYGRHTFGDLGVKLALQPLFLMLANGREQDRVLEGNELRFDPIVLLPELGITYQVFPRLRLVAEFSMGFTDVAHKSPLIFLKPRQGTLGIRFSINAM